VNIIKNISPSNVPGLTTRTQEPSRGRELVSIGRLKELEIQRHHLKEAEEKAIDSLSRYKFAMFGYWAGIWVHLNKIEGNNRPNPFKGFVHKAREVKKCE